MRELFAVRRDRRGRGPRGVIMPEVPIYRTRSQRFDDAVMDVYEPWLRRLGSRLDALDVAVDRVPRMHRTTMPWPEEVVADGPVPLARLVPEGVDRQGRPTRPRVIFFLAPIVARAETQEELLRLLNEITVRLLAVYLNVLPSTLDPRFEY